MLKQSTAITIKMGAFLDDTDGKTAETGLSIAQADVRVSKNGGANATKNSSTATTHDELGYYNVHLSATDTDTLGNLKVMVSKAGALPVWADFQIVTANVYDTFCSTGKFEVTLTSAYDKAKDDVLTPLAVVDGLIDTLVTRLTSARAGYLDKLDVAGTLANTNNASSFMADVSGLLTAAGYTAPDNTGIGNLVSRLTAARAGYLDKLNVAGTLANTDNADTFKADVSALAKTGDAMTLTAAYDKAKDDVLTPLAVVDGVADAIKAKTDNLPASPAAVGSAMTLADSAITAAKIASSAITDAKIATDAISAAKVKADAVTKIQNGLATPTNITAAAGVKLHPEQGGVEFDGQVKIVADVEDEGAFHVENENADGIGNLNMGGNYGQWNRSDGAQGTGQRNIGGKYGQWNEASAAAGTGQLNKGNGGGQSNQSTGSGYGVTGYDPAVRTGLALEATLTAMKGAGWTDETLVALLGAIEAIDGGLDAAGVRTALGMAAANLDTQLSGIKTETAAIKGKTDTIPANPAKAGDAMTLTSAYDAAKTAASQSSVNAIPTTPLLAANYTAPDNAGITAIKAKTDNLPANTATALTNIQADLDNPNQYKADVSGLATEANATTNKGAILTAIDNKPVTPVTDISGLATKTDVSGVPDALLSKVVVGAYTLQQILKIYAAIETGVVVGGGSASFTYTGADGTAVMLSGVDENGNRTLVSVSFGA